MQILKILFGFLALGLAWGFMFRTGLIYKFNSWIKEHVFNDQLVLYSRRRLAALLFLLGLIALFSGIDTGRKDRMFSKEIVSQLMEEAKTEFRKKNYQRVIIIGKVLTRAEPYNVEVWDIMANSYWALDKKEETKKCLKVMVGLDPNSTQTKRLRTRVNSDSRRTTEGL